MMNKLVPQDMFDFAANLAECKNQLVVTTSQDKVLEIIRALEENLKPWQNYLNDTANKEAWIAFDSIKITELTRAWALELCLKNITDTFSYFTTPADIAHFSASIDEAKNRCLQEAFGKEDRPLSELFKRHESSAADFVD